MRRAIGVEMAFVRIVKAAQHVADIDDRADLLDLLGRHQPGRLDADRLKHRPGRFQPFPALRVARHVDAAGHVQTGILAGLGLDLAIELDRVVLQRGDIGIGVERMEAGRGMPGGAGRQLGALDERHVAPAEPRQVIEHRSADHASPDDDRAIMRLHELSPSRWRL